MLQDLVSYRIQSLIPVKLEMCVVPTAGLHGAVYLDEAFESHLRTSMGTRDYDKIRPEIKAKFLNEDWEHGIKRNYKGSSTREWPVYIPGYKPKHSLMARKTNVMMLAPAHINGVFQPICNKIVDLVDTQVRLVKAKTNTSPKAVLLVGGFGENRFLYEQLEKTFKGIPVQQPSRAWSAVSRGAVVKGLSKGLIDDAVVNFISKYNYGIIHMTEFDDSVHDTRDRWLCPFELTFMAKNQIQWYLRRGDDVKKVESVTYHWYEIITSPSELRAVSLDIYISEIDRAPSRMGRGVKRLCTINTHFNEGIYDELPIHNNAFGESYRKLAFTLDMQVSAGNLNWLVYWGAKEQGKAQIHVNYQELSELL